MPTKIKKTMENLNNGWIKIHRKIREWQHYGEPSVLVVFIDLLLSAKTESGWVHGIKMERGQVLTSIARLMANTGIGSNNTVRTALKKLEASGEIEKKSTNKYTLITINQFDKYQCSAENAQQGAQQTAQQGAQQTAHIKEINNNTIIYKEEKNKRSCSLSESDTKQQQHPSLVQIIEECKVKHYTFDATAFYAYYEANGWTLKKGLKMKNWRAAMYAWQRNAMKEAGMVQKQATEVYDLKNEHLKKYDHPNAINYDEFLKRQQKS